MSSSAVTVRGPQFVKWSKADLLNNIVQEIGLTTKLEAPDYRVMLAIGYSPLAHQNPMVICRAARSSGDYDRPFLSY